MLVLTVESSQSTKQYQSAVAIHHDAWLVRDARVTFSCFFYFFLLPRATMSFNQLQGLFQQPRPSRWLPIMAGGKWTTYSSARMYMTTYH